MTLKTNATSKLRPEQEREIIDAVNDVLSETGWGEVTITLKRDDIDVIKAIYRKSKNQQPSSYDA